MNDYPIIKFAVLFVIGILTAAYLQIDSIYLLLSFTVILILLFLFSFFFSNKFKLLQTVFIYLLIIISVAFIAQIRTEPIESVLVKYYKEKNVVVFGRVETVELKRENEIVINLLTDSIFIAENKFIRKEKLLCKFRGDTVSRNTFYDKVLPGNTIYLEGIFYKGRERRNPGEFDYNKYLISKGISGIFICNEGDSLNIIDNERYFISSLIFELRKVIDDRIHKIFDPETAGLLRGLLLADRSEIDFELKTQFINSGVIHVLAVSGLHVGYIFLIFIFLFGRFNIYLRTFLISAGLLTFMFITGVPPSVFRATVMSIIILLAFLSNRSTNLLNSISLAGIIILLVDPSELFNPGFQLSFSAVLSIAIIYPIIEKQIHYLNISNKTLRGVILFIGVSLSAQIGTLPFTLAYFGKLSVIALLANLIVIPAIGIVIALAFASLFVSIISIKIASYFAVINDLIVSYLSKIISFTGNLQYSFIWIPDYSLIDAVIFYTIIALLIFVIKYSIKWKAKLLITLLAAINIIYLSSIDDIQLLPDNKLSMMMIDVGQGDAILIKFPDSKIALIDGGDVTPFFDNGERIIIPLLRYLGIKKIDYGFITHLDSDHLGGFVSIIYNNLVNELFIPKPDTSAQSTRLVKFLEAKQSNVNYYSREVYDFGGARLYILNDDNDEFYNSLSSNDKSGLIKLVYGDVSFLFTGDIERKAEDYYSKKYGYFLDADVLKAPHHGSKTSSSKTFLEFVSPKLTLISAGIKNRFNHPSPEIIERLESFNSKIYRTDWSGAILVYTDGCNIEIVDWK